MKWKIAEAKNRLGEVVNLAISEGPQTITRRQDEVVVISRADYQKLRGKEDSFVDFLMEGPSLEGVNLKRDPEEIREIEL